MNIKSTLCIALLAFVLFVQSGDATVLKATVVKAKIAAASVPHVAAHIAVAGGVKAKVGAAIGKSIDALKAKKVAAVAIITAPLQVAAKTAAIKVGAVKAVVAKTAAHVGGVVHTLQKHPIIVPVPVAVAAPVQPVHHHIIKPIVQVPIQVPVPHKAAGIVGLGAGKLGHVLNALHG